MGRSFYEDDANVITKPGENVEISDSLKEKESNHGNITYIQGMTIRTTPILEKYSNSLRLWLSDKLSIYTAEFDTQISSFRNEVNSINHEINSTIKEPVLPALIYIVTATLTGSILASKRSFPVRFLSPIVFGTGATAYFAPKTFDTITSKYESYEQKQFPQFNKQKHELLDEYNKFKSQSEQSITQAKMDLQNSIHDARLKIIKFVSDKD